MGNTVSYNILKNVYFAHVQSVLSYVLIFLGMIRSYKWCIYHAEKRCFMGEFFVLPRQNETRHSMWTYIVTMFTLGQKSHECYNKFIELSSDREHVRPLKTGIFALLYPLDEYLGTWPPSKQHYYVYSSLNTTTLLSILLLIYIILIFYNLYFVFHILYFTSIF